MSSNPQKNGSFPYKPLHRASGLHSISLSIGFSDAAYEPSAGISLAGELLMLRRKFSDKPTKRLWIAASEYFSCPIDPHVLVKSHPFKRLDEKGRRVPTPTELVFHGVFSVFSLHLKCWKPIFCGLAIDSPMQSPRALKALSQLHC